MLSTDSVLLVFSYILGENGPARDPNKGCSSALAPLLARHSFGMSKSFRLSLLDFKAYRQPFESSRFEDGISQGNSHFLQMKDESRKGCPACFADW